MIRDLEVYACLCLFYHHVEAGMFENLTNHRFVSQVTTSAALCIISKYFSRLTEWNVTTDYHAMGVVTLKHRNQVNVVR